MGDLTDNIKTQYREYKYKDDVPFVSMVDQLKKYLSNKEETNTDKDEITEVINNNTQKLIETIEKHDVNTVNGIENVTKHIDNVGVAVDKAKEHICCDICCSTQSLEKTITNKIDSLKLDEKFSDLNEQVNEIKNKIK